MRMGISREEARDMEEAHAEGLHDELPREGCPMCSGRELRSYPTEAELARSRERRAGAAE